MFAVIFFFVHLKNIFSDVVDDLNGWSYSSCWFWASIEKFAFKMAQVTQRTLIENEMKLLKSK